MGLGGTLAQPAGASAASRAIGHSAASPRRCGVERSARARGMAEPRMCPPFTPKIPRPQRLRSMLHSAERAGNGSPATHPARAASGGSGAVNWRHEQTAQEGMKALVLGSAAGGGFPQWNSNAAACNRARRGDPAAPARTQASLAVSAVDRRWYLFNASPDLRQQIEAAPELHPREGLRSSPIAGVVLTGGDVDAIAGLLTLRERQPLTVYATAKVQAVLKANSIFDVLAADTVARVVLTLERSQPLSLPHGAPSGLSVECFA